MLYNLNYCSFIDIRNSKVLITINVYLIVKCVNLQHEVPTLEILLSTLLFQTTVFQMIKTMIHTVLRSFSFFYYLINNSYEEAKLKHSQLKNVASLQE